MAHVSHAEAPIKEAQAFLARTLPLLARHDVGMAAACLRTAADIALDSVGKVAHTRKAYNYIASCQRQVPSSPHSLKFQACGKFLPWKLWPCARTQPQEQRCSLNEDALLGCLGAKHLEPLRCQQSFCIYESASQLKQ